MKDSDDALTNARLNKLLYFAQGHSLAILGKPLFDEDVEAWTYGPVVPSVYHRFKNEGKHIHIHQTQGEFHPECFSREELNLLANVLVQYSRFSTSELIEMSHQDGGPWHVTFDRGAGKGSPIDKGLMASCFSNIELKDAISEAVSKLKPLSHRDSEGRLVICRFDSGHTHGKLP